MTKATESAPSSQPAAPRWLMVGILLALTLVAANLLAWRSIEADLWGHIQYGEDWMQAGKMPLTATHTFSAPDHPWVNHENLFELSVAWLQRTVDGIGLMVLKCIAGIWLLSSMVRSALRRGISMAAAVGAMIPVAWGLAEFWLARPQLFSFIFFGLQLVAIERAFATWNQTGRVRTFGLWMCVPMMVLWTNSHGGFAAGLCVLLAVLGLRSVEAWLRDKSAALPVIKQFAAIGGAACLAIFVNPYGYELPWWMLISLSQPRPEVSEWVSMFESGVTLVPFLVLMLLTLACMIWSRERRDWVEFTVLLLIAVQAVQHMRHLAFLAIAFGYWMPAHLQSLGQRLVEWRPSLGEHKSLTPRAARWLKLQLLVVNVALAGVLIHTFATFGVDRREYPVSAFEFMAREKVSGRMVVTFDWAQYALAALNPDSTVGFDGRYDTCYPQEVVDMNFDLLFGTAMTRRNRSANSGPVDPLKVLSFGDPTLVLLDRRTDQPGISVVDNHPDWVRLYQDGLCILWGRWDVFDDPSSPHYLPAKSRELSDTLPTGIAQWPGFPGRSGRLAFSRDAAVAASTIRSGHSRLTEHFSRSTAE